MTPYIIRRVLLLIPTLFILSLLVFLSVRFIPGDVVDVWMHKMASAGDGIQDYDRESFLRFFGLDEPVYVQYGRWIGVLRTPDFLTDESHFRGLLQGTFGESIAGSTNTIEERIIGRLPVTIELGVMAIVIGLVIALPVGIYSAIRQDTAADYVGRSMAVIGMATPNFWLAIILMIYPVIWWGWSPPLEYVPFTRDPLESLKGIFFPSLILGTGMSAATMRLTRTMMLEVLRQDYIRTARSKGLRERVVVLRHALKNALIPIVTLIGMQLPMLVGGAVIIENIFNLPGLGQLFIYSLVERDYPLIQGINLFFGTVVMLLILMIDLIYPYLDPRVRYS
ncbi:ABC transporter permease [Dehalococcoidia bacterium]|nr:ABC transporter permease [Dehalococcoidia bacterium]